MPFNLTAIAKVAHRGYKISLKGLAFGQASLLEMCNIQTPLRNIGQH